MHTIRKAAVSGQFYPDDPQILRETITDLLKSSSKSIPCQPKAIIVPHAGYIYSGLPAAAAFSCLAPFKDKITRIVLFGPAHRIGFSGLATSSADYFETPLGNISLDLESNQSVLTLSQVNQMDEAHQFEHSLEVELPFLQEVLNDFSLVPIVVGDADAQSVSEVLELLWGDQHTLVVISSDLSHFLDYETAQRRDRATSDAIEKLDFDGIEKEDACGRNPVKGLLVSAQKHGLKAATLALCNSGDTAGDKSRVVGYGAWVLT